MAGAKAVREIIPAGFDWTPQQEIDWDKVEVIRAHLRAGGSVPPVVVAKYRDLIMPIDGHHRTAAHHAEGLPMDAWTVKGSTYERLTRIHYSDTEIIFCGGIPAFRVAEQWSPSSKDQ